MRADLPMYALPGMAAANAAFWDAVRAEAGVPLPPRLQPGAPVAADIVFTQLCGWPMQTIHAGQAWVLGVPCYAAPYCDGPTHAGVFVVRRDDAYAGLADLRGARFAVNSRHSNTGWNLPRRALADMAHGRFFSAVVETGAHMNSLARVLAGDADATCIDSVTYAFALRHAPAVMAGLRVLAATPPSPAIPFVTSTATPPALRETLRLALQRVGSAPDWAGVREALLLIAIAPSADYSIPLRYAAEAAALGYPDLA